MYTRANKVVFFCFLSRSFDAVVLVTLGCVAFLFFLFARIFCYLEIVRTEVAPQKVFDPAQIASSAKRI